MRGHECDRAYGNECGDECGDEGGDESDDGPGKTFANSEVVEPGALLNAESGEECVAVEGVEGVADTAAATASKAGKIRLQSERDRATASGCQQNWSGLCG